MKKSILRMSPYLVLVAILAAISAAVDGYLSIVMMHAIDTVKTGDKTIFHHEAIKLIVLSFCLFPSNLALAYAIGLYKRKAVVVAKTQYVKRVFEKNINEFQKDNNSKYVSALSNDVNTIETNYIEGLQGITVKAMNFIVAVFVMAYVSPLILGVGVLIGGLSTLLSAITNKPMQKHQAHRSELYEGYTSYIKEVLSAFHIIKSNNLTEKVQKDFYDKSHTIQYKGYIIDKIHTYIIAGQNLMFMFTFIGLLSVTVYFALIGHITMGGVILIVTNADKMMGPLMQISELLPKVFSTKILFEKIEKTLQNHEVHQESKEFNGFKNEIQFDHVAFDYDGHEVLKNIQLNLKKGEKYLVIGPSGGGKSTFLRLLRKYFLPAGGRILIDGEELKDIQKISYFAHIANIEQQVFLFEDTLRNNLTLYKDYAPEEIELAIQRAGLSDFVAGLAEGLDSRIVDNGKNISGGEKSRVAIARGLLQKADILFLDEAFASLDSVVAKEIEKTILGLKDITLVNVSHVVFEETKHLYHNILMVKNKGIHPVLHESRNQI